VIGAVIIVLVVVVILPVSYLMLGGIVAALFGHTARATAERDHEGSELIDLNR
jgi:hypothetical protein